MTNSGYIAHTTPLLIKHGLLNVRDMYKPKLLKFYYLRQHYIHAPLIKRVYAECSPLFQLIKLINCLKSDVNDTILNKIGETVICITDLHSMSQGPSWIHMIPFIE